MVKMITEILSFVERIECYLVKEVSGFTVVYSLRTLKYLEIGK